MVWGYMAYLKLVRKDSVKNEGANKKEAFVYKIYVKEID